MLFLAAETAYIYYIYNYFFFFFCIYLNICMLFLAAETAYVLAAQFGSTKQHMFLAAAHNS